MDEVITLSSDESDIETVDSDPLPLSAVRVVVDSVDVEPDYIDLTDSTWEEPWFKPHKRQNSTSVEVIDLTESDTIGTDQELESLPSTNCGSNEQNTNGSPISGTGNCKVTKSSFRESSSVNFVPDSLSKHQPVSSLKQHHKWTSEVRSHRRPLSLKLPSLEIPTTDLKKSKGSVYLTKDITQMLQSWKKQSNDNSEAQVLRNSTSSLPKMEPLINENTPVNSFRSVTERERQQSSEEFTSTSFGTVEPMDLDGRDFNESHLSNRSSHDSPTPTLNSLELSDPELLSNAGPFSKLGEKERSVGVDIREVCGEDKDFVCPVMLKKIMARPEQTLFVEEDEGFRAAEELSHQSLCHVRSTIDVDYPKGTLEQLSDLLQPGYYLPRAITSHLLQGILLNSQCPRHLCVQAFNLLMKTQRYHMADKDTVPWDWELLTSVIQDPTNRRDCEVVRMLLEYIVQTLEDDFQAKHCTSAVYQSIAKATLSCDHQFPQVRMVIEWLFSAIMKSTEYGESNRTTRERTEQIRMVTIFQRMLSLALEVDCSPALTSAKLSRELFRMLNSNVSLRAHRMLLLESLQSKLLRCKLLEHLLEYACPQETPYPMSLSLLLHFLKNCTLAPDPTDDRRSWLKWEELIHLLRMLLTSYNKAMTGYLHKSFINQRNRAAPLVFKPEDRISNTAVQEAVEAFRCRSQTDLGQVLLPPQVEESLSYLVDHLLDVCQY